MRPDRAGSVTGALASGTGRRLALIPVVVLACSFCEARQSVATDFCSALTADDRPALRALVDEYLGRQVRSAGVTARVALLREWLEGQPCVASAALEPVLSDTEPPVQQIRLKLEAAGGGGADRRIGVVLDPSGPRFDYR